MAGLGTIFWHVEAVTGQGRDHFQWHSPLPLGRRQHCCADVALAVLQDVDEGFAVEAQRHRPPQVVIVDPGQTFYETYACGADNNPDGYCNPAIDRLIDSQSAQLDEQRPRGLVWEIERRLAEDGARPIIHHSRQATCRQPYLKGFDSMINSVYNGWRFEDLWLDK